MEQRHFRHDGWRLSFAKTTGGEGDALIEHRNGTKWLYRDGLPVEYTQAGGRTYRFVYLDERMTEVFTEARIQDVDGGSKLMRTVWLNAGYDEQGRIATLQVGPNRHVFTYADGANGPLVSWTANGEEPVRFTYKEGLLTEITRGSAKETFVWTMGPRGLPILASDDNASYTWVPSKDMLDTYTQTRTDKLGRTSELRSVGPRGETVRITPDGARTTMLNYIRGNGRGQLRSVTGPDGVERVQIDYNEHHLPIARREAGRAPVLLRYDDQDRLVEVKRGEHVVQRLHYLASDKEPDQMVDASGAATDFFYNDRRQLTQRIGPYRPDDQGKAPDSTPQMNYHYDASGRVVKVELLGGATVEASYDEYDRLVWTRDASGFQREYRYGANARLAELREILVNAVNPEVIVFKHDKSGRLIEVTRNGQTVESWLYDDQAIAVDHVRRVTRTDAYGAKTIQGYDAQGNLTVETNAAGETIRYRYDAARQLTGWTDGRGGEVTFARDALGRITEQRNSARQTLRFGFDIAGRTIRRDNGVNPATFVYDGAGRLENITYEAAKGAAPQVVRYAYDNQGRLSRAQTSEVTTILTYDELDRVKRREQQFPQGRAEAVEYVFDAVGRRTELITLRRETSTAAWEALQTTVYRHDVAGRLAEMRTDGTLAASYAYDATTGRLATKTFGNGVTVAYAYDGYGRETRVEI